MNMKGWNHHNSDHYGNGSPPSHHGGGQMISSSQLHPTTEQLLATGQYSHFDGYNGHPQMGHLGGGGNGNWGEEIGFYDPKECVNCGARQIRSYHSHSSSSKHTHTKNKML